MAQPRSQLPLFLGLTAAGGVGYYLYSAGGSPKAAEKQFEADLSKASAKVKSELPGRANQAQHQAEAYGHQAGAKFDEATAKAKAEYAKAESKFDSMKADAEKNMSQFQRDAEKKASEAKAEAMKKIDQFDAVVEKKAAEAKSGLSSWFGGK